MKYIKKISDYSIVGGMGAILVAGLSGCESPNNFPQNNDSNAFSQASQKQGAFVVIQETAPKQYTIVDEFPSESTRVILKTLDGQERILTQAEMDALVKDEATKIDNGTSNLTNSSMSSGGGGMGLGEVLLASAAGAILGSWIGGKLFNNQNYQQKRRTSYKSPQTYSKSKNSFNKAKRSSSAKSSSSKRSGFFGNSRSGSSKRSSFGFGG